MKHQSKWALTVAVALSLAACSGNKKAGGGDNGGEEGEPCRLNSDCARGEVCDAGACAPECVEDRDCEGDYVCHEGWGCLPPDVDPPLDEPPREIEFDPDEGLNIVFAGCGLDSDCASDFECKDSHCVAVPLAGDCDWGTSDEMARVKILDHFGVTALTRGVVTGIV